MAQWNGDRVQVWTHSQGVYLLRADLALVLKLPLENITVEHMEGAGCYGHNGADDVALDAALLAKAAGGRPVRVQWSRADEMSHAPFGAAMTIEIEADLDANGEIVAWRHASGATATPRGRGARDMPALLAATELAKPFPRADRHQSAAGQWRRRRSQLDPALRFSVVADRIAIASRPCRSAPRRCGRWARRATCLRSNPFSTSSPPSAARIRSRSACVICRTSGAQDVIRAVARRANWKPAKRDGIGYGIGFARYKNTGAYCAVIAEVEGAEDIRVKRLTIAVDVGEAINPDGVDQPDRGRRDPGHELGAEGARSLRPRSASPATPGPNIRSCASARCPRSRSR